MPNDPAASAYDFELLLERIAAAPAQCEGKVLVQQYELRWGGDALSGQQIEQVIDAIAELPE